MNSYCNPEISAKLFVANPEGEALVLIRSLFCKRNAGKIDLPGGKQDTPEGIEETALRELYEETGIAEFQVALRGVAYVWEGRCDDGIYRQRHYLLASTNAEPIAFSEHTSSLWVPPYILLNELPNRSDIEATRHVLTFGLLETPAA